MKRFGNQIYIVFRSVLNKLYNYIFYLIVYLHIFSGKPVDVKVSVSLRNILEIDEHKQVNL